MVKQSGLSAAVVSSKKTVRFNCICAIAFVLAFIVIFAFNIISLYNEKLMEIKADIESNFAVSPKEEELKKVFDIYMKLTNRKNINGVTILNDGRLMIDVIDYQPFFAERTDSIIMLNDYLQKRDIPFLFIRGHSKLRDSTELPWGYYNNTIEYGNRFLVALKQNGIDTLDLREEMLKENMDFATAFFHGDVHWTGETAFWAFGKASALMNSTYGLQLDTSKWDSQEYQSITYYKSFLGHESERVGRYAFKDDFTVVVPRFITEFKIDDIITDENEIVGVESLASGDFVDVFTPRAKNDHNDVMVYEHYNTFAGGFRQYENLLMQGHKRVLLVADSFGYPFATYLSTAFERVDHLYINFGGNYQLYPALESREYDMVLLLLSDGTVAHKYSDSFQEDRLYFGASPQ